MIFLTLAFLLMGIGLAWQSSRLIGWIGLFFFIVFTGVEIHRFYQLHDADIKASMVMSMEREDADVTIEAVRNANSDKEVIPMGSFPLGVQGYEMTLRALVDAKDMDAAKANRMIAANAARPPKHQIALAGYNPVLREPIIVSHAIAYGDKN